MIAAWLAAVVLVGQPAPDAPTGSAPDAPTGSAPDDAPTGWAHDEQGRMFRVAFDPGSRLYLGAGWAPAARPGAAANLGASSLEAGWLIRERDDDPSGVSWKLEHALVTASIGLGSGAPHELPVAATLYEGRFVRWSRDGALTIPTVPPSRLAIPFDLGAHIVVARARTLPFDRAHVMDIDAVRAELVLDLWRTRAVGSAFALEFGADYDLRLPREGTHNQVVHRVAPFTQGALHFHHEWDAGKQLLDARVEGGTAWTSTGHWRNWAGATAAWEWTFLAINDAPVALRLAGTWRWDELAANPDSAHELEATVGLRFALFAH